MLEKLRSVVLLVFVLVVPSCGGPPPLIGVEDTAVSRESVSGLTKHRVFITTTRQRSGNASAMFSGRRAEQLGLASVLVTVPPGHESGKIERARSLPPDPRRHFTAVEPRLYQDGNSFVAAINAELSKRPRGDRDILFFVHGYNNTLSDSVLRVAQFVEDSGFNGVPVVFSWASAGKASRYVYDLNSVLAARQPMEEASAILIRAEAEAFDVFAHSMGTLLVMEVMVQSDLRGNLGSSGRLSNVMLAAPDIDIDVFRSQLEQIGDPGNVYVFVSRDDGALRASRLLSGGVDRVGVADPGDLADLGVTVIDVTSASDSPDGAHAKFAGSPEVVRLIGASLERNHYDERATGPKTLDVLGGVVVLQDIIE